MPPVSAAVAAQVLQADPPCPSGYIVTDITKYVDLSSDGEAAYLRADWMPLLPALSYVTLVPSGESGLPMIFLRCDPSVWGRRLRSYLSHGYTLLVANPKEINQILAPSMPPAMMHRLQAWGRARRG
jgi:hypothetical protein